MKKNLYTSFYIDPNPLRQAELEFCLQKNLECGFDSVHIFVQTQEEKDRVLQKFYSASLPPDVVIEMVFSRLTFAQYFYQMEREGMNILCNSDIFMTPDTLTAIDNAFCQSVVVTAAESGSLDKPPCLALSRWDYFPDGTSTLHDHPDSQDTWVFLGKPNLNLIQSAETAETADGEVRLTLGIAGCDNKIAYLMEEAGYFISNPAKSVKTYHYHVSNIRNYLNEQLQPIVRILPPYHLIPTT